MSEEYPPLDNYDVRRIEALWSPLKFQELSRTVEEVCLSQPVTERSLPRSDSPEAALVGQLGTRGLRAALDFIYGKEKQPTDSGDDDIRPDSPLRYPEEFSDSIDPAVIDWAERFGDSLLSEAYLTLGDEVDQKIEDYAQAQTADQQIEVLDWLNDRLVDMKDSHQSDDSSTSFYHPIRLSPKVIGRYPNITAAPTCLSVSIIAASFLRQAQVDLMHAGVVETQFEIELDSSARVLEEIIDGVDDLSDVNRQLLIDKIEDIIERRDEDRGYHAAVYTRLVDNRWYQIDPNYRLTMPADGVDLEDNQRLDQIYDELVEFQSIAPGLEIGGSFARLSFIRGLSMSWDEARASVESVDPACLSSLLRATAPQDLAAAVQRVAIDPYFMYQPPDGSESMQKTIEVIGEAGRYQELYDRLFNRVVLDDMSPEAAIERCQRDDRFLHRRIEDIQSLPSMMFASVIVAEANHYIPTRHSAVELGLPEARIGMAVLNDFAANGGSDLPASFWMTHWPSLVPTTENIDNHQDSEAQRQVIYNNLGWAYSKHFAYNKSHGIIPKYISDRDKE